METSDENSHKEVARELLFQLVNEIPKDVLYDIANYLEPSFVMRSMACVNKEWRATLVLESRHYWNHRFKDLFKRKYINKTGLTVIDNSFLPPLHKCILAERDNAKVYIQCMFCLKSSYRNFTMTNINNHVCQNCLETRFTPLSQSYGITYRLSTRFVTKANKRVLIQELLSYLGDENLKVGAKIMKSQVEKGYRRMERRMRRNALKNLQWVQFLAKTLALNDVSSEDALNIINEYCYASKGELICSNTEKAVLDDDDDEVAEATETNCSEQEDPDVSSINWKKSKSNRQRRLIEQAEYIPSESDDDLDDTIENEEDEEEEDEEDEEDEEEEENETHNAESVAFSSVPDIEMWDSMARAIVYVHHARKKAMDKFCLDVKRKLRRAATSDDIQMLDERIDDLPFHEKTNSSILRNIREGIMKKLEVQKKIWDRLDDHLQIKSNGRFTLHDNLPRLSHRMVQTFIETNSADVAAVNYDTVFERCKRMAKQLIDAWTKESLFIELIELYGYDYETMYLPFSVASFIDPDEKKFHWHYPRNAPSFTTVFEAVEYTINNSRPVLHLTHRLYNAPVLRQIASRVLADTASTHLRRKDASAILGSHPREALKTIIEQNLGKRKLVRSIVEAAFAESAVTPNRSSKRRKIS